MEYARYFDAPDSVIPPFYNVHLVEAFEKSLTEEMQANMHTAFDIIANRYSKLTPTLRDSEHGYAMLVVVGTGLEMMLATKGKFKAAGKMYFNQHKATLVAMANKSKQLVELLRAESRAVRQTGVPITVPMRAQNLTCLVCMKTTKNRCAVCREFYFCDRDCLVKSNHRKGKTCFPFAEASKNIFLF